MNIKMKEVLQKFYLKNYDDFKLRFGINGIFVISFLLLLTFSACNDDKTLTKDIEMGRKSREHGRKLIAEAEEKKKEKNNNIKKIASTTNDSKWKPEVRKLYRELLLMKANEKENIIKKVHKLSNIGPDAREALGALAGNVELPDPQEAMCGMKYPGYFRFNLEKLISLLEHPNKYVRGIATDYLQNYGGKRALEALKKKTPKEGTVFGDKLAKIIKNTRPVALPLEANQLLNELLNISDKKELSKIAVSLANDYIPEAEKDLLEVLKLNISNKNIRTWAAIALTTGPNQDLARLTSYTKRKNDLDLRYNAALSLSKLGDAGMEVLKKMAESPDDPLYKAIQELLK